MITINHLEQIQKNLASLGWEGYIEKADGAEILTDVLILPLIINEEGTEENEDGEGALLTLTYLPGTEEFYKNINLLQLMIELPVDVDPDRSAAVNELILRMNQTLGIGAFYLDQEDKVGLRQVIVHDRFVPLGKSMLEDAVNVFLSMYEYTVDGIDAVNDGADAQDVFEELFG